MSTIKCCNLCYERLLDKDSNVARLWLSLCEGYSKAKNFLVVNEAKVPDALDNFKVLERMRFLSTCDGPKEVQIRMEGYLCNNSEHTFCVNRKKHKFI